MTVNSNEQHVNYRRIEEAIIYLEKNFRKQPELTEVADNVHLSPYHFQKIFTEWAGISPKKFLQYLTVDYLKQKLAESRNLIEAADHAGLSSQSRVYDLFTTLEAVTPNEYKLHGAGLRIHYGIHETPFGHCLIGVTERGICWLSFLQTDADPSRDVEEMKLHWHNSIFHQDQLLTFDYAQKIFGRISGAKTPKLHVLVKGTNFQLKVWEALLKVPMGELTTYQDIAKAIGNPRSMQAVGSAVGSNHIAYLIPCHRVIRKDGVLGEYRWSSVRKKGILGWEMAKANPDE